MSSRVTYDGHTYRVDTLFVTETYGERVRVRSLRTENGVRSTEYSILSSIVDNRFGRFRSMLRCAQSPLCSHHCAGS